MSLMAPGEVTIDPNDERAIQPSLEPGERLLWAGHPRRGLRLVAADAFMIPFSLVWCGFSAFWEWKALSQPNSPPEIVLFGLPFIAVGFYVVFGRFVADAIRRGKITYALTTRGIIIAGGVFTRSLQRLDFGAFREMSISERGDRSGTITLGSTGGRQAMALSMFGASWPGMSRNLPPMLELIENARAIYDKIRAVKTKAAAAADS